MENRSLNSYWYEAKCVIGKWGQPHWNSDDECVAFVSSWMMRADWKYDPDKGAKMSTYRINAGRCAVVSWANKLKKRAEKSRQTLSLNVPTKNDGEYFDMCDEIPAREDKSKASNEIAEKIVSNNCNSEKLQSYLRLYYIDGYNCAEIAKMQGVSKQAVNEGIRRAILKLREQKALKNILTEC